MRADLFLNMMNPGAATEFATNDEAEDYVLENPTKMALVIKNRIVIATFHGAKYESD